ncbi:MAG: tetratricopeptide repeat protein [Deltaproteobacteria bacterium]|nr:tetratricopeptide repeat protein [Deltaproteobacteria bacterium]
MIKLIRIMVGLVVGVAAFVYLFFFAKWNPEVLGHSVRLTLWNYEAPFEVTVYPVLVLVVGVAMVFAVSYTVGYVPAWLARGKVGRGARKGQVAIDQLEEALDLVARKDPARARKALGHALGHPLTHTASHLALADLHLAAGQRATALELLEAERVANPASVRVSLAKAKVLEADGRPAEAASELRRALRESGPSVGVLEALRDLVEREGNWEEAYTTQQHLTRLLREAKNPTLEREAGRLTFLRYEVARRRIDDGKVDDAVTALRDILKRNPGFVPAAVTLGDALVAKGQEGDALKVWERAFRVEPQLVLLDRLESLCLKQGDPGRVVKIYQEALARDAKNLVLRFMYGKFCLKLEMVDEALEQFDQIESAGAHFLELSVLRGEALHRRKNLDAAVEEFRKAVRIEGLRYVCRKCATSTTTWGARCEACGEWDTLRSAARLDIEAQEKSVASVGPLPTV